MKLSLPQPQFFFRKKCHPNHKLPWTQDTEMSFTLSLPEWVTATPSDTRPWNNPIIFFHTLLPIEKSHFSGQQLQGFYDHIKREVTGNNCSICERQMSQIFSRRASRSHILPWITYKEHREDSGPLPGSSKCSSLDRVLDRIRINASLNWSKCTWKNMK